MGTSQIISLAMLALFSVFLLVGFLIGLARGMKKASLRLSVFIVTTIMAFLITPLISKLALGLDLSFVGLNGSLSDMIQQQISQQPEAEAIVNGSTTLQSFIEQIPYLVLNLVTFLLVFLAINFIGFIVYQVLKSIFFKKKKEKEWRSDNAYKVAFEDKKPKKHRLVGGLVGGLQSVAFLAIFLLPVSGFAKIVYDITYQPDNVAYAVVEYSPTAKLLQEQLPQEVLEGIKAYKTSAVGIASTVIGADSYMFDSLTRINVQTEEGKLKISYRSEFNNLAKIYNNIEFLTKLDFETISYKDLDYDKIENAVKIVFESKLLNALVPEALNWVVADINKPQEDSVLGLELGAQELGVLNKVVAEYKNTFGSIYKGIKNDFNSVIKLAVEVGESGLVDEALSETLDIETIKDILMADNKKVVNQVVSKLFDAVALRVLSVEAINYGLDEVSSPSLTLSKVSYDKVNWNGVIADFNLIFGNLLDMIDNVSEDISGGLQEVITENPYELLYADTTLLTTKLGEIMKTLQTTNLLVDENGNKVVYNQFMDYLNTTEYAQYVDFAPFKQENTWVVEMANLNNILLAIKKSAILSEVVNNIDDLGLIDYNSVLSKISAIDSDNGQTYTHNILSSVLNSNVFKKAINLAFDLLNDMIEENQEMLGAGTELGKVQGHKLNSEQEKANILAFFDNIISYVSEINFSGNQETLVSEILSSNLSKLGQALDAIAKSAIFGEYTENGIDYDGVYISLIYALNNNAQFSNFADFSVVLDEDFDGWNVEFNRVQTIIETLQDIKIDGKPLLEALIDGDDLSTLIEDLTTETIDSLIDPIIESQLLAKNVTMFVDTINSMVADFTQTTSQSVSPEDVIAQKEDVKVILKKALDLTSILTDEFDENTLKNNATVLGEFLNLLKANKLENTNGVFAQTYNSLVNYLVDDASFGSIISDLLDEYENQDDIDWEELFELFIELENQDFSEGFTTEFKTLLAGVISTMKQDENYNNITVDVISFMESFNDLADINTLEDFILAYTNALTILANGQDAFALGNSEYYDRVVVVLDFFNNMIPVEDIEVLDIKKITIYSDEVASAFAIEEAINAFDDLNLMGDDEQEINQTIDNLLFELVNSQLLFDLMEDSSLGVQPLNNFGKTVVKDRIDASYSGETQTRLYNFFEIV